MHISVALFAGIKPRAHTHDEAANDELAQYVSAMPIEAPRRAGAAERARARAQGLIP